MSNKKGRTSQCGTFNPEAGVKHRGRGARADLPITGKKTKSPMFNEALMEDICERSNLQVALKRVMRNKGAPGIDGMTVDELPVYLKTHWPDLKELLFRGKYVPQPVRRVEIPKAGKSREMRNLGIPNAIDRFIQQAILQVLQAKWDQMFSDSSFGFRPGRSAHQAVAKAQSYLREGYEYIVDIDLEKIFR